MDIWLFRLAFTLVLIFMLLIPLKFALPRSLKAYALWKSTEKESHLRDFLTGSFFVFYAFLAVFIVLLKKIGIYFYGS
jgi:hypothetical protein